MRLRKLRLGRVPGAPPQLNAVFLFTFSVADQSRQNEATDQDERRLCVRALESSPRIIEVGRVSIGRQWRQQGASAAERGRERLVAVSSRASERLPNISHTNRVYIGAKRHNPPPPESGSVETRSRVILNSEI